MNAQEIQLSAEQREAIRHAGELLRLEGYHEQGEELTRILERATSAVPVQERYKVVEGSQSAHCCFKATVVDMENPVILHGKHFDNEYEAVCETFSNEDAEMICAALNRAARPPGGSEK